MTYRLVYTHRAVRDIKKLPEDIRKRIGKTLLRYQTDPLNFAENLTEPALGTYRFRVGDYRIIFDLEGEDYRYFTCWTQERALQEDVGLPRSHAACL